MDVDKNVPEIRFKGFGGEWVETELGDSSIEILAGGDIDKEKFSTFGKYPVLANALTNDGILGYYQNEFRVKAPAVTVTGRGDVGHAKARFTDFTPVVRLLTIKTKHNVYFLEKAINNHPVMVESTGVPQLTVPQLSKYKICFPTLDEQTAIGNFFQKLDNLINQHQQKHDKLSSIKKAMLEKMFPKQGKTVPEIRFKGFVGGWVEIGLLDSIERIIDFRGRTPKKLGLDWSPSGYRALSALNVKQGYIDFSIDPNFGDQELYDRWMSGSELHKDQVLFTTEAPMGNVAQVPNSDKYILSQRTIAFVVKDEVITEDFLATLLRSPKVFLGLSALSSGGTAKGVSQKNLANFNILLPKQLGEQTAIGNHFQKLDTLINQHQQQITKLNNIKQACLSKMFV